MESTVYIVDYHVGVRQSLLPLLQSAAHTAVELAHAKSSRCESIPSDRACLILDMRFPNLIALDVLDTLADKQSILPLIIISDDSNIPTTLSALNTGEREYPTKPIQSEELLRAVDKALVRSDTAFATNHLLLKSRQKYETLTRRQREVLSLVTDGLQNKQIARALGIQEVTVKFHKKTAMEKMGTKNHPFQGDTYRVSEAPDSRGDIQMARRCVPWSWMLWCNVV